LKTGLFFKIFDEMKAFMGDKEIIRSRYVYWGMMDTEGAFIHCRKPLIDGVKHPVKKRK